MKEDRDQGTTVTRMTRSSYANLKRKKNPTEEERTSIDVFEMFSTTGTQTGKAKLAKVEIKKEIVDPQVFRNTDI